MRINIQSFSDIITNSSSELFCTIHGGKDLINIFNDIISPIFPCDDPELSPSASYNEEENTIEIELPYEMRDCADFYEAGLEAILGKLDDITIDYE